MTRPILNGCATAQAITSKESFPSISDQLCLQPTRVCAPSNPLSVPSCVPSLYSWADWALTNQFLRAEKCTSRCCSAADGRTLYFS
mmetsp:Transcript_135773/g.247579  ORF Transcript_135773/g.247579 Transcript_135773/m.247579 type:complete len:86 (+) Transcript_135773:2-259(+)